MSSSKPTIICHVFSNPLVDKTSYTNYNMTGDSGLTLPVDLLSHQEEHQLLQDIISKCADKRYPISLVRSSATINSFRSCFKISKILHFSGHGVPNYLCFEEDGVAVRVSGDELYELCKDYQEKPLLVFLSACFARTIASAFIKLGVRYVVTVTDSHVNDEGSIAFSTAFYRSLLIDGLEVEHSFNYALSSCKNSIKSNVQSISLPNVQNYLYSSQGMNTNGATNTAKFELLTAPEQLSTLGESVSNYCYQIENEPEKDSAEELELSDGMMIPGEYRGEWETLSGILKLIIPPLLSIPRQLEVYGVYYALKHYASAQINVSMKQCRIINIYGERGIGKTQVALNAINYLLDHAEYSRRPPEMMTSSSVMYHHIFFMSYPMCDDVESNECTLQYELLLELAFAFQVTSPLLLYNGKQYCLMDTIEFKLGGNKQKRSRSSQLLNDIKVECVREGKSGVIKQHMLNHLYNQVITAICVNYKNYQSHNHCLLVVDGIIDYISAVPSNYQSSNRLKILHYQKLQSFFMQLISALIEYLSNLTCIFTSTSEYIPVLLDYLHDEDGSSSSTTNVLADTDHYLPIRKFSMDESVAGVTSFSNISQAIYKSIPVKGLSNIQSAELFVKKCARALMLIEMQYDSNVHSNPLQAFANSEIIVAMQGNPRVIVEVAKYINNNPNHTPANEITVNYNYNLVLDASTFLSTIIPSVLQNAVVLPLYIDTDHYLSTPSLGSRNPSFYSSMSMNTLMPLMMHTPVNMGKTPVNDPISLSSTPVQPGAHSALSSPLGRTSSNTIGHPSDWCEDVWEQICNSLGTGDPKQRVVSWKNNPYLESVLLQHGMMIVYYISYLVSNRNLSQYYYDSASWLAFIQMNGPSPSILLNNTDIQFYLKNSKLLNGKSNILYSDFEPWFQWFHASVINTSLISKSLLNHPSKAMQYTIVHHMNHATASKKLMDMPAGTFIICCSESKPCVVIVYVGNNVINGGSSTHSNILLKINNPVQIAIQYNRPITIFDAGRISQEEVLEYADGGGGSGDADGKYYAASYQCNTGEGVQSFPSFESLIMETSAITHLYPCIPKHLLFIK